MENPKNAEFKEIENAIKDIIYVNDSSERNKISFKININKVGNRHDVVEVVSGTTKHRVTINNGKVTLVITAGSIAIKDNILPARFSV